MKILTSTVEEGAHPQNASFVMGGAVEIRKGRIHFHMPMWCVLCQSVPLSLDLAKLPLIDIHLIFQRRSIFLGWKEAQWRHHVNDERALILTAGSLFLIAHK